jgi:5-methyltetrahydropteroyltriglutamate--homocysteine methyltransferase
MSGAVSMDSLRRIRVDQVGSLVASPALRQIDERYLKGAATEAELTQARDAAIRHSVKRQEEIGLPVVTDGELRRRNFQESFGKAVEGFDAPKVHTHLDHTTKQAFARAEQDFSAPGPVISTRRPTLSKLKLVRNVPLEEYEFCRQVASRPVKVTLVGPDRISQRFDYEKSRTVYKDVEEFLADVIRIERQMIQALVDRGCRYIQIDAPGYTAYVDQVSLDRMRARGEDPDKNLERSIRADNDLIAGFDGVVFGIHVCRGNPRTVDASGKVLPQWHREGFYDGIAERLFSGLNHHRLLLEYDSERAGGFSPLRFVPKDKVAVLGLVTTKSAELESADGLRRRIDEAAKYLPLDRLALSPQCGFGGIEHVTITEDEQWRKFERILEVARLTWGG